LATHAENSADMVAKNRSARGEKCGKSKLTEEQVKSFVNLICHIVNWVLCLTCLMQISDMLNVAQLGIFNGKRVTKCL